MSMKDNKNNGYQKVSHVAVHAYVVGIIAGFVLWGSRVEWVCYDIWSVRFVRDFILASFGILFHDIILGINLKKLIESGKSVHPVRDCFIVITPLAFSTLSIILALILIK